ncbi:hypothetical protein B4N89_20540 [Embleya scabrispora]|uniref:DUF7426 domain-containing protein n=1 Tax=Embleya scabrispora TaxID=159449 RepID=A0A1T3P1X8_9ACTN|nr:hypothetical protein B4N89_20540 [Embleya scabrispora]
MGLPDLDQLGLTGEYLELPIKGTRYRFKMVNARLGRALVKAASTGRMDSELLGDDQTAAEYKQLLGEHYTTLLDMLDDREFMHVCTVLVTWVIAGKDLAERVWTGADPRRAPAGGNSSAGAPARTASTSTTSTRTGRPRSRGNRRRR